MIRIVELNTPISIDSLRSQCTHTEQLVSIKSVEHVIWLDAKVKASFGDTATSQPRGIPLGYDYTLSNQYYDLNDPTRSIQHIFDALRAYHGWGGDYLSDQTSEQQNYAGFGWSNHGIEDWGEEHDTHAVICEDRIAGEHVMMTLQAASINLNYSKQFTFNPNFGYNDI